MADLTAWVMSYIWVAQGNVSLVNALVLSGLWMSWFVLLRQKQFRPQPFWSELLGLIKSTIALMALVSLAGVLSGQAPQIWSHAKWGVVLLVLVVFARALAKWLLQLANLWGRPALIFGGAENAQQAALALQSEPSMGYLVTAFIVPNNTDTFLPTSAPCRSWPQTEADFAALRPFHCVIALEASQSEMRDHLIRQLLQYQIKSVSVIPSMRGVPLFGLDTTQFFSHEVLMIHIRNNLMNPIYRWIKRIFDLVGATCLILLLSPLMLWVAYKIWSSVGGPVIFTQPRIGQGLKTFKFYKFRSMVENAEDMLKHWEVTNSPEWQEYTANNFKLAKDPRLISIGALIRRTSIDELPQLFNVIMGDMSLVGPRPLLPRETDDYGEDLSFYGQTPPGLTGLWQVSGRSQTTFEDRVVFDVWYVKNWSIWIDIAILFKTWSVVFKRNGAY
jgi:Undecaprenyl-phosphate galactose phosphotransferase WbaP